MLINLKIYHLQLFSKMLLGYNNNQDLDKLVSKLEENHDLLADMVVREESSEIASALPKLILDLLNQTVDEKTDENPIEETSVSVSNSGENCFIYEFTYQTMFVSSYLLFQK